MRVFVTGASGFIGSSVVKELIANGHHVLGLARSDASADAIRKMGADVHRGALDDLESLKTGASSTDGTIHTAFIHDFSGNAEADFASFQKATATDKAAIDAIGDALAGSNKPFVTSGGTLGIAIPGRVLSEDDLQAGPMPRKSEEATLAVAKRGVRASVIRLSPSVHGERDRIGFIPMLIKLARETKRSVYVGEGKNHWTAVDVDDAASLFRLALEKGEPGARFHGVGDESIEFRAIAESIAKRLGVPAVSLSPEEAQKLGFLGYAIGIDSAATNALSRERLGWQPKMPGLLEDMQTAHYFA